MLYQLYILRNNQGKIYIGHTSDLSRRLIEHNKTGFGYTSKYRPWSLIYQEKHPARAEAMARKKFFKTGRGRDWIKENLRA